MLGDLEFCTPYLDNILIASSNEDKHEYHLQQVLNRLKQHGLKLNLAKFVLGKSPVSFLGCLITPSGVLYGTAIAKFSKSNTIAELRRFLAVINFYCRFIPHTDRTQAPLHELLKD